MLNSSYSDAEDMNLSQSYPEDPYDPFESDYDSFFRVGKPITTKIIHTNTFDSNKSNLNRLDVLVHTQSSDGEAQYGYDSFESNNSLSLPIIDEDAGGNSTHYSYSINNSNLGGVDQISSLTLDHNSQLMEMSKGTPHTKKKKSVKLKTDSSFPAKASDEKKVDRGGGSAPANLDSQHQSTKFVKYQRIQIEPIDENLHPLPKQTKVRSNISQESKQSSSYILQRQLDSALKKLESYRRENQVLTARLDESRFRETIEKFKSQLIDNNIHIEKLTNENICLKEIARHQTKFLVDKNKEKENSTSDDDNFSYEKQIEVLMIHIKKINSKTTELRDREKKTREEAQFLKNKNQLLESKNVKLNRKVDKLSSKIRMMELSAQDTMEQNDKQVPLANDDNISDNEIQEEDTLETCRFKFMKAKSLVTRLERSLRLQRDSHNKEVVSLKSELSRGLAEQKRLESELNKQEALGRQHITTLKQLRSAYDELKEGNKRLIAASDLYSRDHREQQPKPPTLSRPISTQSPRASIAQSVSAGKGAVMIDDEMEQVDANMTFITSEQF
eukprot:gene14829-19923_t